MKRPESSFILFRERIPADVLPKAAGLTLAIPVAGETIPVALSARAVEVKFSLRTRDPAEAKARHAEAKAHLARVWQGLRDGVRRLTHKETVALAGEVYQALVGSLEDDPGPPEARREAALDGVAATLGVADRSANWQPYFPDKAQERAFAMEGRFGPAVDAVLARHVLVVDADSRRRLLDQAAGAMLKANVRLKRNAEGDYSPDTHAQKFPEWRDNVPSGPTTAPAVTLTGLVAGWRVEAVATNRSPSTIEGYERTFRQLTDFLGHDDAARVTPKDVVAFKDHRLASLNPRTGRPLTAKTVNDADLVALKSVFGWGVDNFKVPTNPAAGISIKKARVQRTRSKGFTDDEANALLAAAWRHRNSAEHPKTEAAKRWVPWLCAYTGARVGEIAQLRREDVRKEEGVWAIHITPEAGTIKNGRARWVVLHSHLLEMGFLDFARASDDGPLFLTVGRTRDGSTNLRGVWQGLKNRLQDFARETVTDPRVAPNHGWRHRFKTVGRRINMPRDVLHDIQAHRTGDVGDDYGEVEIPVQAQEIEKMPRYPVP